jgi:hypothetical protein
MLRQATTRKNKCGIVVMLVDENIWALNSSRLLLIWRLPRIQVEIHFQIRTRDQIARQSLQSAEQTRIVLWTIRTEPLLDSCPAHRFVSYFLFSGLHLLSTCVGNTRYRNVPNRKKIQEWLTMAILLLTFLGQSIICRYKMYTQVDTFQCLTHIGSPTFILFFRLA